MARPALIAVLRHADYRQPADTPSALLPYPLTEAGEAQAREAGEGLAGFLSKTGLELHPTIDCSHMLRAWQTARIIADTLGGAGYTTPAIDEFDGLAERSVGAAANLTVHEIERILAEDPRFDAPPAGWKSSRDFRLPLQGAESLADAGRRVAAHLNERADGLDEGQLKLIVGHGASIRHAACELGLFAADEVGRYSMYHAAPIFLSRVGADWRQEGGEWKRREQAGDSDEFRQ